MTRAIAIAILALTPGIASEGSAGHAGKAAVYVQRGDLKSAEAELRKAVELSPNDPALLTSLGGVLGMQGDLRRANVYLSRAVKLSPRDPLLLRNLAANEWQLGRFHDARRHLEIVLEANGNDRGAVFLLGMVSENEKDYARSIKLLESIPEIADRQPEALVALASSYYHTNRRQDAESALHKVRERPAKPEVVFMAGRVALDARDYPLAEDLLSTVRSTYSDPAAVEAGIAAAQYRDGRPSDAEKTLLAAVQSGRANIESFLLIDKLLADRGAYTDALRFATEGARKYPDSAELLSAKGAMELKLQYFSAAAATLAKAARMRPSPETNRELALATWRAGNRDQAISLFEDALRRFPRDARTYQDYGTLLVEDASPESQHRAADLFERAVALDGAAVDARFQLANMAFAEGRPRVALEHLEKALRYAPEDSRLHFTLSRVYRRLGRDSDADRELAAYQRLKKPVE